MASRIHESGRIRVGGPNCPLRVVTGRTTFAPSMAGLRPRGAFKLIAVNPEAADLKVEACLRGASTAKLGTAEAVNALHPYMGRGSRGPAAWMD